MAGAIELCSGLLMKLIKQAGLDADELNNL